MSDLPITPFTNIIAEAASENYSTFDFNGYKFADVVRDPLSDVAAGRSGVAMQDVSPMRKFLIRGSDAAAFLDHISTRKLSHLKPGRVSYFLMVNDKGFIRDDGTAYRLAESEYLVQSVSNLVSWLEANRGDFEVEISDVQTRWAEMSVYGRKSAAFLKSAGIAGLEQLKPFNFMHTAYADTDMIVSRTGFSGGLGYELMIPWDDAERVMRAIIAAGGPQDVTYTGNYTGVTLRLDIGFLVPGWDFPVPGDEGEQDDPDFRTPYDMGWDWLVQLDNRDDFVGKAALAKIAQQGARFDFLALVFDGPVDLDNMNGARVFDAAGKVVGAIFTSGYSNTIGKFVAFCNVRAGSVAAGESVSAGHQKASGKLCGLPLIDIPERGQTPPPGI